MPTPVSGLKGLSRSMSGIASSPSTNFSAITARESPSWIVYVNGAEKVGVKVMVGEGVSVNVAVGVLVLVGVYVDVGVGVSVASIKLMGLPGRVIQ